MKQIIMYSKENENRKSENKMSFVEIIKNTLQHKIKYATVISVLLLTLCQVNVYAALTVGDKAVTYDANGGIFSGGTSTNEVTYSVVKELVTKISKTDNVSDDGLTADTTTGYGNSQEKIDVITIPGAEELEVTITYQTQGAGYDWVCLYDKNVVPDSSNSHLSIPKKRLASTSKKTETYIIPGDTVQVFFRSNASNCGYYGYYAVIKGVGNVIKVTSGDYLEPTKEGYGLLGWSTDSSSQTVEYELGKEDIPDDEETILYAIWKKDTIITYDANGGIFSNGNLKNTTTYNTYGKYGEESEKESEITVVSGSYKEPQNNGYTFMGWATRCNSDVVEYYGLGNIPEMDEGTLYAVWKKTGNALIMEWTIPVDLNGAGKGTTIELPIPAYENNSFIVDWGDGQTQTCSHLDHFPAHTYKNTTKTIYTIQISGVVKYFGYTNWSMVTPVNVYQNYSTFSQCLTRLVSWGEIEALQYGFSNCYYLTAEIPLPSKNSFKETISFDYLFYNSGIKNIPDMMFKDAKKAESFVAAFSHCPLLTQEIPQNLFMGCTNAKYFDEVFENSGRIRGTIPEGLFKDCVEALSFSRAFSNCMFLTGAIPGNLFNSCTKAQNFEETFSYCVNLREISDYLFSNCKNAQNFDRTFYSCQNIIGSIPQNLFRGCSEAISFERTFSWCTHLSGDLPENLFSDCVNAKYFIETFDYCYGLDGTIPGNLFKGCKEAISFDSVFIECYSLTGSIPETLFEDCTKATDFDKAFYMCYALTGSIPENLFKNCPGANSFVSTFSACTDLTGNIPAGLLANNIGVTSVNGFESTFSGCESITSVEIDTRFIGKSMFAGCNSLTEITISNRVEEIGNTSGVFRYNGDEPPLYTRLNTTNELALNYNWEGDKRTLTPVEEEPEVYDEKTLILRFTIPVDADGVAGEGTTLVLPVYANSRNNFTVDWGDGDIITYDSTANLPEHKYKNTEQETYTVQITGTLNQIGYNNTPVPTKTNEYKDYYTYTQYLTELLSWGELGATQYGFGCCTKMIGTIPIPSENSFVNVRNFDATFHKCSKLTGTIPENLFSNCSNVTRFLSTFYGCENLTGTIPENLFSNCPNVTSFNFLFYNCYGLTGNIPNRLFRNCPNVKSFDYTFYGCLRSMW